MKSEDTKNMIMAAVLSMLVILVWQIYFAPTPPPPVEQVTGQGEQPAAGTVPLVPTPQVAQAMTREGALERTDRVLIDTASIHGSISLKGGRLDDLHLDDYRETLEAGSDTVTVLNPTGGPNPYYTTYGWLPTQGGYSGALPDANTDWRLEAGTTLTPSSPVTLAWDNGDGLTFRRTIAVDDKYMFTVTQEVENTRSGPVNIAPYGYIARRDLPDVQRLWILHEGAIGSVDDEQVVIESYDDMLDFSPNALEGGNAQAFQVQQNGWAGLTDKYWLTALAAQPGQGFQMVYKTINPADPEYRAEIRLPVITVAAGESASVQTFYFAGAKEYRTLIGYEESLGIQKFHEAIDWGWFYFLTKPLFRLLIWVNDIVGNMGWAIICLTLLVKAVLFPLAYKSYVAMSRMKQLQPEMEKIKERAGDDKQKLQTEMMQLYKKEKVN
ncbi:MAG: membrane protein insertase YidC, partial [Pseudomonadota bacterium]